MKISILTISVASIMSVMLVSSCSSPEKKVENAQENVNDANADLAKANDEYLADIETYKKVTADQIAQNEKELAAFRLKVRDEKAQARADYDKKIADLEEKNNSLKQRMADYKETGKDNWNSFKSEFSHDMDEFGKAFKDLGVNNVKK
ncbi:MAG: peptidase M23 [Bacteroidetes bacterium]|nr:peptidase M23 [Bacteroidota bacterium]